MSGLKKIQCGLPQKPWKDYSSDEIRRYCFSNLKNYDCSFVGEDQEDRKIGKVYKSFKWILWEMSPVLKEILNDEKNQAKNCKEIVVSNQNHIEAILFYGHMKVVDTDIINLLDFYEASKQYQVKILEDEVIKMFESEENQKSIDWVKLYWLSYVKYPEDQQMRAVFEKVKGHVQYYDKVAEMNIDFILDFDEEVFDVFLDLMMERHVWSRFNITEAYLIKNIFDGNKNKKLDDIDLFERNLVEWYINKMELWRIDFDRYKNSPLVSIKNLEKIKSKCVSRTTYDKIELSIQKLREGESNLKTENQP